MWSYAELEQTPEYREHIAIISCVHGNLSALEAVLADIFDAGVPSLLCLGDLVGYGPQPNQVIERLRDLDVAVVRGCWDEGIANAQGHCGCEFASQEDAELGELTYTWTNLEVSEESRAYLKGLPFLLARRTAAGVVAFVHGSTASTAEYLSEETHDLVLLERASRVDCQFLACGHTHIPFARRIHGVLEAEHSPVLQTGATELRSSRTLLRAKTLVNCGSVGEPRHGGPEATYVVLNQATGAVAIRKVPYDVDATVRELDRAGLPASFGQRLQRGAEWVNKRKDILCSC